MKKLTITMLAAALLVSINAQAQQHEHHQPTQPQPQTHEAREGGDSKVDHSKMDHSKMDQSQVDHSQMDHSRMDHSQHAPTQPRTPIPVLTDADRAAARPPAHDHPVHDNTVHYKVLFNRLEAFDADHGTGQEWEGQAWIGTDTDRLWLRSEGERVGGRTDSADLEVLYGRPVSAWWDVVAGVRHDFQPAGSQDWAAIGVVGLAPYKFEVEATAYVGPSGRTAARIEAEYELLLTNRLILQPLVEANLNGKDDERRGVGAGLSTMEAGLRLRYEVHRQFAPYIGIVHERAFGATADFREGHGESRSDTRIVAGVRMWF